MSALAAGITPAGEGIDGVVWNILGQTYVPKQRSENSMAWHATLPKGTFVPPHIHPTQDEFIYVLEGRAETRYGENLEARVITEAGDFLFIPADIPHQPFNLSQTQSVKAIVARNDPNEQESVELFQSA